MALRRYTRTPVIGINKYYGTTRVSKIIRDGVDSGVVSVEETFLHEGERLDTIAGRKYGDSSLWWIIAAASNIGWMCQTNPGILLRIPNLEDIKKILG